MFTVSMRHLTVDYFASIYLQEIKTFQEMLRSIISDFTFKSSQEIIVNSRNFNLALPTSDTYILSLRTQPWSETCLTNLH